MAKKRQWFVLGLFGAVVGVLVKLVRGRRDEGLDVGRWEEVPPAPEGEGA